VSADYNAESTPRQRPALAPPVDRLAGVNTIFWNERELRAGWRLVIFIVLFVLFASAGVLLAILLRLPRVTRTNITPLGLLVQEGVGMIAALLAAAVMSVLEGRPFGAYGLPAAEAFRVRFWQGLACGLAIIAAMILLIRAFGGFTFGGRALEGATMWSYAALWGVVFLCVGFFEEFLFRGYALYTLASGMKFCPAATLLSAIFAGFHLGNLGEDAVGAAEVFVTAMFFCLILRRTGSLWCAVGVHASWDWGETFLFSVPDSGIVAPGHLLNSSLHGPAWLTGGSVGPEASVMAFVVIGAAALIFSRVYPARPDAEQGSS
jgi:membrane protease YdiL (CAAX protease family)